MILLVLLRYDQGITRDTGRGAAKNEGLGMTVVGFAWSEGSCPENLACFGHRTLASVRHLEQVDE